MIAPFKETLRSCIADGPLFSSFFLSKGPQTHLRPKKLHPQFHLGASPYVSPRCTIAAYLQVATGPMPAGPAQRQQLGLHPLGSSQPTRVSSWKQHMSAIDGLPGRGSWSC